MSLQQSIMCVSDNDEKCVLDLLKNFLLWCDSVKLTLSDKVSMYYIYI